MLTDEQLGELFRGGEHERVERKQSANSTARICEAICALANDLPNSQQPGVVFVGQNDDLSCANIAVSTQLLEQLGGLRGDGNIQPFPVMSVTSRTIDGCNVAVIEVQPSVNTPVRYKGLVWIRVGPRRAIASPEEERRLLEKRRWRDLPFDAQEVGDATIDEIDVARFEGEFLPSIIPPEALSQDQRPIDQKLQALRLLTPNGKPTASGLLLFGKTPQSWFAGAYAQFLRIDGADLVADPIMDQKLISGTLPDQIARLDELVKLNIRTRTVVGGVTRGEEPDYPLEAVRQIVRNAILHRTYDGTNAPVRITWYSDRLEVQSPGGPFGQVTVDNFGRDGVTDYRNPTIAGLLLSLRYIERFGLGFAIARRRLEENGNPPLEVRVEPQHVLVVLRARR